MARVDVIIPVYRPGERFGRLLEMLHKQTVKPEKIILINTQREYFEEFDRKWHLLDTYQEVEVRHILKEEFDHGQTRNFGTTLSESPFFVLMTDDAVPKDEKLLEHLLDAFEDKTVAMAYARQLPAEDCGVIESYTRSFNYPDSPLVKSAADLKTMGIKAFFASNVCAAYRRESFEELSGFTEHTIFNEDMIFARRLIDRGYRIAYVPQACVLHSHNYSGLEQLKRNFDLGVSHAEHPEIFAGLSTESEGIRLVKKTCSHLVRIGKPLLIFRVVWQSGCKYLGYLLGKHYQSLPRGLVSFCSMNREYWKKEKGNRKHKDLSQNEHNS